jgi:hypothetical protein
LLLDEINSVFPNYLKELDGLHHVGSEMFVSVALEALRRKGIYTADAGTIGIIGRYWSSRILHPQKPFKYFTNCFLLHLPADKEFMADFCSQGVINDSLFVKRYSSHINSKVVLLKKYSRALIRRTRSMINPMFS